MQIYKSEYRNFIRFEYIIHGGKYKQYASAMLIMLEEKYLIELPFVEGRDINQADAPKFEAFKEHLKHVCDRAIRDALQDGNLKINASGDILPVNLDYAESHRRASFGSHFLSKHDLSVAKDKIKS